MNNRQGDGKAHLHQQLSVASTLPAIKLAIGALACLSLMLGNAAYGQTMTAAATSPAGASGGTQSCGEATGPTSCGASGPASKNDKTVDEGGGNPINVITGNKYQREVDLPALPGVLGLELVRHYNSQFSGVGFPNGIMGRGWKLSYETELHVVGRALQIVQADGARLIFNRDLLNPSDCGTSRVSDGRITISRGPRGDEYMWTWPNGRRLSFDHRGKLVQIAAPTGEFLTLQHDARGHLVQVTDPQGRQLKLNYAEPARGKAQPERFTGVQSIDTPVGRYVYEYGSTPPKDTQVDKIQLAANLVKVNLPTHYEADKPAHPLTSRGTTSSSISRAYHYEDARFPTLLTGISVSGSGSDGKPLNQRISTYGYDQRAWAVRSEHGGQKVELALLERASLSEMPGSTPGRSVLVHGRTAAQPEGRRLEIRSAMVAGDYRITETRGEPCATALPCPRANMRYRYDAKGRLTEEIQLDQPGRALMGVRTAYDPMDRVVRVSQVIYKDGKPGAERWMVRYEYGATGEQPALIAKPSVVAGLEHQMRMTYNDRGQVLSVEENGYSPLDTQGLPVTQHGQASPIKRITRNVYGRINGRSMLVAVDGPLSGNVDATRFRWDALGNYLQSVQPPGDSAMKVLRRDAAGRITLVAEDEGSRYRETSTRHDPVGHVLAREVVAWSRQGNMLSTESRLSQRTGYDYDLHGRLVAIHKPDGTQVRTEFDASGKLGKLILPDGEGIALQRDAVGTLMSITRLDTQQRPLQTVQFDRDDVQRLTRLSDDLGQILAMRYGPSPVADRPTEVEHPGGVKTTYAYDELGFITEQIRAAGTEAEQHTRWQHDSGGRVTSIERVSKQSAVYDDFGRKLLQADNSHGIARHVWDAADRLIARVNDSEQVQRYEYDASGRLIASSVGSKTVLAGSRYDGRLISETTAFDSQGHAGERKQWRYDSLGRMVEERHTLPPNIDAKGSALQFITTLRYDELGRLSERTLVDAGQRAHRLRYTWNDTTGHLTGVAYNDQPVVTKIQASWLGGISAYTHSNGVSERFERDVRGRLLRHSVQAGRDTGGKAGRGAILDDRYAYDGGNRLVAATETTGGRPLDRRYGYDQLGRLVSEQRGGDHATDTYAYDIEGNRIRSTVSGETKRYAYVGQQLVAVEPTARQAGWASLYSPLGEPWKLWGLTGTAAKSAQDKFAYQLTVHKPAVRTIYAPAGPALAAVDDQERLVASYGWGLRGERISKTITVGEHKRTTYYLYKNTESRPTVVDTRSQGLQLYAEADESGRVNRQYVYLDGLVVACIDTPTAKSNAWDGAWGHIKTIAWSWFGRVTQAKGEVYAVHADQRHAPVAVSNAHGEVVWRAQYKAFGLAIVESIPPLGGASWSSMTEILAPKSTSSLAYEFNLRLPGQYWDSERKLHYNIHRDYDPQTGRYTTPDPISIQAHLELGAADQLAGGNFYSYGSSNPLTRIDAQGLYEEDIHYYMNFFLALSAGIAYDDARRIALASQFVDNNPDTMPIPATPAILFAVATGNTATLYQENKERLMKYHFTMWHQNPSDPWEPFEYNSSKSLTISSKYRGQLNNLYAASEKAPTRCGQLQFFGEYLHALADTYGHRDQNSIPIALNAGLGHLFYGHSPDSTYDHEVSIWSAAVFYKESGLWRSRQYDTFEMERALYNSLKSSTFSIPNASVPFSKIVDILLTFNGVKENGERTGAQDAIDKADGNSKFYTKLSLLNTALASLGIKRPDGSAIDFLTTIQNGGEGYDTANVPSEARKNRNAALCTANGKRLNPDDYPGTILPKGSVPCK